MGRATAELFAAEGAKVALFDLAADALDEAVAGIRGGRDLQRPRRRRGRSRRDRAWRGRRARSRSGRSTSS